MSQVSDDSEAQALLATFSLAGRVYALPTTHVQEIVRVGDLTAVHGAPDCIVGIINLRGKIVTVLDLAAKVQLGTLSLTEDSRIVILEWKGEHMGLAADAVIDVFAVDPDTILPCPPNVQECHGRYLLGVCALADQLIPVLDAEAVLADEDAADANPSRHHGGER